MKKHNGGYALVLVLVVMVVLCLLCSFVLTNAVRNLHIQMTAAQRMSDRYAARGEIEKVAARLESAINTGDSHDTATVVLHLEQETMLQVRLGDDAEHPAIRVTARCGDVEASCDLELLREHGTVRIIDNGSGVYVITGLQQIRYANYEISTVEEEVADDAEPEESK